MKKLLLSCALLLAGISTFAQDIKSLPIGSAIPMGDKALHGVNGTEVALNQRKTAKGLLVMFSCNTCPYVIKSQQRTKEAIGMANKLGIGMVIINSNEGQRDNADSYAAMQKYAREQAYTAPYLMDDKSQMADAFGATRTPEVFLFDKDGKLVYHGAMEDSPADPSQSKSMYLAQAMKEMTAGRKISVPETKSIGCGIKRVAQ